MFVHRVQDSLNFDSVMNPTHYELISVTWAITKIIFSVCNDAWFPFRKMHFHHSRYHFMKLR